jgi:hypothetical protein
MTARSRASEIIAASAMVLYLGLLFPWVARAQESHESGAAAALSAALTAACRADQAEFARLLTADNAAAFRALSEDHRVALLKRLSLSETAGKPLLSSDPQNHTVLRCEAPEVTVEFRFGDVHTRENLAFIPVTVVDSEPAKFGLVREGGGWRLLSLGLVLLDIPQLSSQWADQDLAARELAAIDTLRGLSDAVQSYRRAFGKLPESLTQLGPAPKDEISPDQASLINEQLAAGSAGGYHFRYRIVPAGNEEDVKFEVAGSPDNYGKTGRRSFVLDIAGRVHAADKQGHVATPEDPLLATEKSP